MALFCLRRNKAAADEATSEEMMQQSVRALMWNLLKETLTSGVLPFSCVLHIHI